MKIRNGFVSNSSSSSFLIYGISFDPGDFSNSQLENIKEKCIIILKDYNDYGYNERLKEKSKDIIEELESLVDIESFSHDINEYLDTIVEYNEEGLDIYNIHDEICIGRCPEDANDSITFGEWKKNIEKDVGFLIPIDGRFTWIEDCRYDG